MKYQAAPFCLHFLKTLLFFNLLYRKIFKYNYLQNIKKIPEKNFHIFPLLRIKRLDQKSD